MTANRLDMPQTDAGPRFDGKDRAVLILGVAVVGAIYVNALANGFVGLDDDIYITANPLIAELSLRNLGAMVVRPYAEFYHPVTLFSLALDRWLWGLKPFGYHLTDFFLHLLNTALVFWVGRRIVFEGARGSRSPVLWARTAGLVASLLFGLHPLHVESVAWAAQRKDLLCTLFYLLAFGFYLKHAADRGGAANRTWYRLSLLAFLLSLLSKSMAVTLPVALLLIDYYPLRRLTRWPGRGIPPVERAVWREKLPFFGLALAFAFATIAAQRMGGALRTGGEIPWSLRPWFVIYSYAFYMWKMIWPFDLTLLYPIADVRPIHSMIWSCLGALVALALAAFLLRRRWPAFTAAFLYYIVTLAPVAGVLSFGAQVVADRYSYLPLLGPFLLAGAVVGWINQLGDRGWRPAVRTATGAVVGAAVAFLAWQTSHQIETWRDAEELWRHHLAIYPRSDRARFNLAVYYQDRGQMDRAVKEYRRVVEIRPSYYQAQINLGAILLDREQYAEAAEHFRQALKAVPNHPGAHLNLGISLLAQNKAEAAQPHLEAVVEAMPDLPEATMHLARALEMQGRSDEAQRLYEKAVALDPDLTLARERLGVLYLAQGEPENARREFQRTLDLNPQAVDARIGLAELDVADGHPMRALGWLSKASEYRPKDASLHLRKAEIVRRHGALGLAESSLVQATKADPQSVEAWKRLGLLLEEEERFDGALEALVKARTIFEERGEAVPGDLTEALERVEAVVEKD